MDSFAAARFLGRVVATTVVAGGLAACGSGEDRPAAGSTSAPGATTTTAASTPPPGPPSTPTPTSSAASPLSCLAGGRSLPGAHGTNATVTGRGSTAVVFVNTADGTACDWADYAKTLVADGSTVVAYDYATPDGPLADRQRELRGVVAGVKAQGAERVVVIGGSRGGCLALIEAASSADIDAVGVLSCAKVWNRADPTPLAGYLAKVRQPVLSVVAAQDPDVPESEVRADAAALPRASVLVVPGDQHGVPLLAQPRVTAQLTALVRGS